MKIVVASDHAGYTLRMKIVQTLKLCSSDPNNPIIVKDLGHHSFAPCDFPEYANKLCELMKTDTEIDFGILVCGSGMGMSMAANRHKHIRCALCRTSYDAKISRQHNNANVLALGQNVTAEGAAVDILFTFIDTKFSADVSRYGERMDMIS